VFTELLLSSWCFIDYDWLVLELMGAVPTSAPPPHRDCCSAVDASREVYVKSGARGLSDGWWCRRKWCCSRWCVHCRVDGGGAAASFTSGLTFLDKQAWGCQAFWTCCCSTALRAHMEAFVMSASGMDGSRHANRVARNILALHFSKALRRSSVQVTGWVRLTLEPERTSWKGAECATVWGRNRLQQFSMPSKWQCWLAVLEVRQSCRWWISGVQNSLCWVYDKPVLLKSIEESPWMSFVLHERPGWNKNVV
jgi:hypothetical protein